MTLEIDIDKLNLRRGELDAELKRIDGLILLAEQFCKPVQITTQEISAPVASGNGHHREEAPVRGFTAGLRRAVILALHTGPATESDLAKALVWPLKRTRTVVGSMIKFRICFLSEHGRLTLAEDGKKQAAWYMAHPEMLTYRPGLIGLQ